MSPDQQQTADDLFLVEANAHRTLRAMQMQNYAMACGLPGVPEMGPLRVTNNTMNQPAAPPPPTTASQPPSPAAGGLFSNPVVTALLAGIGAPALLIAGSLLPGLFGTGKTPAPVPVNPPVITQPATPEQVDLGTVGADGHIIPPGTQ